MSYNSVIKQIELNLSGKENAGSYDARLDWIEAQLGIAPVAPNLRWNVEARIQEILRAINLYVHKTVSGTLPLTLTNAVAETIASLIQYGKCVQASSPTPAMPVPIACNNGNIVLGWRDVITSSTLSGYGTYVSPTQVAGNRAYRWFENLPNGTYKFSVDGNYELIVQWRDPANPSEGLAQSYDNLSSWGAESGEVTLDKQSGGYGVSVRRASGTDNITPSNFDGVIHVQANEVFVYGTPEILSVNSETANVNDLFSCGEYEDEQDVITGEVTHKVGVKVFDGTEASWTLSKSGDVYRYRYRFTDEDNAMYINGRSADMLCSHFEALAVGSNPTGAFLNGSSNAEYIFLIPDQFITTADTFKAWLAMQYAGGTPVMVLYPLAEPVTEQTEPQILHTEDGTNTISITANVTDIKAEVTYCSSEA